MPPIGKVQTSFQTDQNNMINNFKNGLKMVQKAQLKTLVFSTNYHFGVAQEFTYLELEKMERIGAIQLTLHTCILEEVLKLWLLPKYLT